MQLSRILRGAILAAAISLTGLNAALAAKLEDIHATRNVDELKRRHGPTRGELNAQARANRYKEILSLDAESTLVMIKSSERKTGNHYRFQQQFQGVPVYGATIKIGEDLGGNLQSLFGHIVQDLARDLTSTVANLRRRSRSPHLPSRRRQYS